jgi:hypothetical protein
MPLNIALDSLAFRDGRIVLSGRLDKEGTIDAALFLTAGRLACEPGDPYFSLDPEDGMAWSDQGRAASEAIWERIKGKFKSRPTPHARRGMPSAFSIQTMSARQDFPDVWNAVTPHYPAFRSKLVFRPVWLRDTRFGEILYEADVLLKELAGGAAALKPGRLRAAKVPSYASSDSRRAARGLLAFYNGIGSDDERPRWQGHRLWFDLTSDGAYATSLITPIPALARESELLTLLDRRGLLTLPAPLAQRTALTKDGDALDLSGVFPKMFVRRHDHSSNKDLIGDDADLTQLSSDVNARFEKYALEYRELHSLVEVFRAYVAAVQVIRAAPSFCKSVMSLPLFESEKISKPLPQYHASEIFFTFAAYEFSTAKHRRLQTIRAGSQQGGVIVRARAFIEQQLVVDVPTILTKTLLVEAPRAVQEDSWITNDNRRFVVLALADTPKSDAISFAAAPPAASMTPRLATPAVAPDPALQAALPAVTDPAAAPKETEARRDYELALQIGGRNVWDSFLAKYPTGFYADLARAQRDKLIVASLPDVAKPLPQTAPTPRVHAVRRNDRQMSACVARGLVRWRAMVGSTVARNSNIAAVRQALRTSWCLPSVRNTW